MLKKIEIKGFKSFADRTKIDFERGITCIVGPNGSGKSNITDAFRWVLGEQSYKSLRGTQMSDVIFGGTITRPALGYAEVSVVLDNSSSILKVPYDEVAVNRKLYRSGESEYSINGNVCRLKDVKDLFVDTGIGVEGYSIIGQGRIDQLLSTGKQDRRLIFEEASGIVKYRIRKEEAARKLDKSSQHIERIEDITGELESRLEPLRQQSEKASVYLNIKSELKGVEISLYLEEIDKLKAELAENNETLTSLESKSESVTSKLFEFREAKINLSSKIDKAELERQNLLNTKTELEKTKIQNEGNLVLIQERIDRAKTNLAETLVEIDLLDSGIKDHESEIQTRGERVFSLEEEFKKQNTEKCKLQALYDKKNQLLVSKEGDLALLKADRRAYFESSEALQIEKAELKAKKSMAESMMERINEELTKGIRQKEFAIEELKTLQGRIDLAESEISEIKEKKLKLEASVSAGRVEIEMLENDMFKLKNEVGQFESEAELLERRINNFEGSTEPVKMVMSHALDDDRVYGTVASLIDVDEKYEVALEQILGARLENVVTSTFDVAREYIDLLREKRGGRVTFMPLDTMRANDVIQIPDLPGIMGPALDYVRCDDEVRPAIRYLLYNVAFAEDLFAAKGAQSSLPNGYKIVTLEGDVVNVGGTVSGGFNKKHRRHAFKDKRRLDELKADIVSKREFVNSLVGERERHIESIRDFVKDLNDFTTALQEKQGEKAAHAAVLDATRKNIVKGVGQEQAKAEQLEKENDSFDKATARLAEIEREEDSIVSSRADSESKQDLIKRSIDEINSELGVLKKDIDEKNRELLNSEFSLRGAKKDLSDLQSACENMAAKLAGLRAEELRLKQEETKWGKEIEEKKIQVQDNAKLYERAIFESNRIETILAELKKQDSEDLKLYKELENKAAELKDEMYAIRINVGKLDTKLENQIQGLWSDYEMSYAGATEFRIDLTYKDAKKQVRDYKRALAELGEVNVLSIGEYKELKERYDFMNSQRLDLQETMKKLKDIIRDMDKQMRTRFRDSIEDINERFGRTFKGLFRGGNASIDIDEDDDILEAEIVINAQPPGKKLQTIELLSGGEKALTAIAILFAILETKPAPFCVLDEIEAALDDRNIALFSSFVKDYVSNSQFILITHRKGTMEIADAIYGVTMKEKGVTGVLSLKLSDDADKLLGTKAV